MHKDALDRIRDDNLENKQRVRYAVGSVKGYGMIARKWEKGHGDLKEQFMEYITQRKKADWKSKAETIDRVHNINEEWRKTCNVLKKDNETLTLAAVERISELEAELAELKLIMSKMRAPRENKSVRNRRRREEAEAAAAGAPVGSSVGSPQASSSSPVGSSVGSPQASSSSPVGSPPASSSSS